MDMASYLNDRRHPVADSDVVCIYVNKLYRARLRCFPSLTGSRDEPHLSMPVDLIKACAYISLAAQRRCGLYCLHFSDQSRPTCLFRPCTAFQLLTGKTTLAP